jgi:hypothetical protein
MAEAQSERKGCLNQILDLLFPPRAGSGSDPYPYKLRDKFASNAELSFYHVLKQVVGDKATILIKVNLADIFYVATKEKPMRYRGYISQKHVDFLLCDPGTLKPRAGIELDDSSHEREDRQKSDALKDNVFKAAGLPLIRVPAQRAYDTREVAEMVRGYLIETGQ